MNAMKRSMLLGAFAASATFFSCSPPENGSGNRASGSLALSHDDSTVFVVDTDNNLLAVIDPTSGAIKQIPVGKSPVRVIVGSDDTAFVTNRGDRSVSVVRFGDTQESARIGVGIEPHGMALTPDGKTLLVVSASALDRVDQGTLSAIDTQTLEKKWEIQVGEEPRAVAVIAGDRALVSLFKSGELVEVDLNTATVRSAKAGIYSAANATRIGSNTSSLAVSTFRNRAVNDLVATADGKRVFAPTTWAREDAIARRPSIAGGYYASGGPCNIGAVTTAGIVTVETANSPTPQVDDLTSCFTSGVNSADKDFPSSTLASSSVGAQPMQGPTVGVIDPTGEWLMVLNRETRNLVFMPAWKRSDASIDFANTGSSVRTVQSIQGHGADGLAVTNDFKRAYVYSQFDHQLEIFEGQGSGRSATVSSKGVIRVTGESITDNNIIEGRKLFFDALDTRMSSKQTNVACSSCHLDGREDGHVWQFPDGPRQTPALAGRKLLSTAPYHWSGEFMSLNAFNVHTITERMGGTGLDALTQNKLDAFIEQLPPAENALKLSLSSDALSRGKAAFEKASCNSCHAGELLTNNGNANVGTLRSDGLNPDNGPVMAAGFNVPSLLGIGRTAPYLHDGSMLTLDERVYSNEGDRHGLTSMLSAREKVELVTYLKSL